MENGNQPTRNATSEIAAVDVVTVEHEGLGNASYLIDLGDGRACVVDPQRDIRPYLAAARRRHLKITHAIETHVPADFVTGSRELAAAVDAQIIAAAGAKLRFGHRGLGDGDRLELGGLTLEMVHTPGHTPHHASWLLRDGETPAAVFTGGALIVGGVARTDLVAPDQTEALARAAYQSVTQRLLALPDNLPVWPTHGPGSFCSADAEGGHATTIGTERCHNPLLIGDPDEDEFVRRLLEGLGSHPDYFTWLPEYNRAGPTVYGSAWPTLTGLTVDSVQDLHSRGAQLVDVRPIDQFAAGHIPGSVSNQLRPQFASFLGWVIQPDQPVVFVTDNDTDLDDLLNQSLGIGYELLAGYLDGGLTSWSTAGLPLARIPLLDTPDLQNRIVVDVRQDTEFARGHLPDAVHVELGALPDLDSDTWLGHRPVATMCAHGQRSMTAASLMARQRGTTNDLAVYPGSAEDWAHHTGRTLTEGT